VLLEPDLALERLQGLARHVRTHPFTHFGAERTLGSRVCEVDGHVESQYFAVPL
jgi:hypothetical protein